MDPVRKPASFGSEPARRNRWRAVLLTFCVLTGIALVVLLVNEAGLGAPPWFGLWGAQFAASGTPYTVSAEAIDPHGASAKGGLRRNDVIDLRGATLLERFAILSQPVSGHPIAVTVKRGTGTVRLTIVPSALTAQRADIPISTAGTLLLVLFAGLILMRRAFVPGTYCSWRRFCAWRSVPPSARRRSDSARRGCGRTCLRESARRPGDIGRAMVEVCKRVCRRRAARRETVSRCGLVMHAARLRLRSTWHLSWA